MGRSICIAVVVASLASISNAADPWLGQRVYIKNDALAKVGDRIVDAKLLSWPATVEDVNGDWLWLGRAWVRKQDIRTVQQVLDYYTDEIRRQPSAANYHSRAGAWEEKGEVDNAIADITEAIRLDPRDSKSYNNRSVSRYSKKDYDGAISDCNEAIRLNPKYVFAYINRGRALAAKENYDGAIKDFTEAIRLDPKEPMAYWHRADAFADKGNHNEAIKDYNDSLRLDASNAYVYRRRGQSFRSLSKFDDAIRDYTAAIRLDPKIADSVYFDRGNVQHDKKQYDLAIKDYTETIRLDPKAAGAFYNRARTYSDKEQYEAAIKDYSEAIRLNPKHVGAYNAIAWLRATCPDSAYRNGQTAVENANKACELSNWKEPGCLDTLAAAFAENGDFQSAQDWQSKAIDLLTTAEGKADYQMRLDLYKAGKPYHEE